MSEKSYPELLAETRTRIREVSPAEASELRSTNPDTVLLDVRELPEWNLVRIPGAKFLPLGQVKSGVTGVIPARDTKVIVYCARGNRSVFATEILEQLGYTDVSSMAQGIGGWMAMGGDVEQ